MDPHRDGSEIQMIEVDGHATEVATGMIRGGDVNLKKANCTTGFCFSLLLFASGAIAPYRRCNKSTIAEWYMDVTCGASTDTWF